MQSHFDMEIETRPEPAVQKCQGCGKVRIIGVWRSTPSTFIGFNINYTYCPDCYAAAFGKEVTDG